MKNTILLSCLACLALSACNEQQPKSEVVTVTDTTLVSTQEEPKKEKEWIPIDSAEGMKAYMEYAKIGDEHKELAKWDGKWTGDYTMWETEGGKPFKTTLQSTNKMILEGHYQQSSYKGNMMGMNFEGIGITGYDNALKKYISTWTDNMGTGIMKLEGTRDEASKSTTYTGTSKNPANGMDCEVKQVLTDIDDNTQKLEMYGPDPKTGNQFKNMEILLKRSK